MVPVLDEDFELPKTVEELLSSANGKSALNSQTDREGFVIRSHDMKTSFKVISNAYILKHEQ